MNPSRIRRFAAVGVVPLLVTAAAIGVGSSPSTAAPGVPAPGTVIYNEGFENGTGTAAVSLSGYTGAGGQTYIADPAWLTNCNGIILSHDTTTTVGQAPLNTGCDNEARNSLRRIASALGTFAGNPASSNHALAAYTHGGHPGAGKTQLKSQQPIPVPAGGRFLALSVDGGAVNCAIASAPQYAFYLGEHGGTLSQVGSNVSGCGGSDVNVEGQSVNVQTYTQGGSSLFTGTTAQIELRNPNGSGNGNDAALDNFRLVDVTPTVDKEFTQPAIAPGETTTLTLTITNTDELGAKNGWGLVETLPAGVVLASPTVGGTCGASFAGNSVGSGSLTVTDGVLPAGQASCTIILEVTAQAAGEYQTGPAETATTGLNPPATATLSVAPVVGTPMVDTKVGLAVGGALALLAALVLVGRRAPGNAGS